MKLKLISTLAALAVVSTVAVSAASSSSSEVIGKGPEDITGPAAEAAAAAGETIDVDVTGDESVEVDEDVIAAAIDAGQEVITLDAGAYTLEIDIANGTLDNNFDVRMVVGGYDDAYADEEKVTMDASFQNLDSETAFIVNPVFHGDFGTAVTFKATLPAGLSASDLNIYHIMNNGIIDEYDFDGNITVDGDVVSFTMESASSYIISANELYNRGDVNRDGGMIDMNDIRALRFANAGRYYDADSIIIELEEEDMHTPNADGIALLASGDYNGGGQAPLYFDVASADAGGNGEVDMGEVMIYRQIQVENNFYGQE